MGMPWKGRLEAEFELDLGGRMTSTGDSWTASGFAGQVVLLPHPPVLSVALAIHTHSVGSAPGAFARCPPAAPAQGPRPVPFQAPGFGLTVPPRNTPRLPTAGWQT